MSRTNLASKVAPALDFADVRGQEAVKRWYDRLRRRAQRPDVVNSLRKRNKPMPSEPDKTRDEAREAKVLRGRERAEWFVDLVAAQYSRKKTGDPKADLEVLRESIREAYGAGIQWGEIPETEERPDFSDIIVRYVLICSAVRTLFVFLLLGMVRAVVENSPDDVLFTLALCYFAGEVVYATYVRFSAIWKELDPDAS